MALTLTSLCSAIRDTLIDDSTLEGICLAAYEKSPTITVGNNRRQPDDQDTYPLIIVSPQSKSRGDAEEAFTYTVNIAAIIAQDERVNLFGDVAYLVIQDLESILDQVETSLAGMNSLIRWPEMEHDLSGATSAYPLGIGVLSVTAEIDRLIGGAEPVL